MKTVRILRKWHNDRIDRDQFLVEFESPLDPNDPKDEADPKIISLLPDSRSQRVRFAVLSQVQGSTVLFVAPRGSAQAPGDPHGMLVAEHVGSGLSLKAFLESTGYAVEDDRRLLPRSRSGLGMIAKIGLGVAAVAGGVALLKR